MRKLVYFFSFFALSPFLLFLSLVFFSFRNYQNQKFLNLSLIYPKKAIAFSSIPITNNLISSQIFSKDDRVERLYYFLHLYNSPLQNYAQDFVSLADLYSFDYRILPAIAMQESGGCKTMPKDSYNCWGWGIYTNKITNFPSFYEALKSISKQFSSNYYNRGLTTPLEIGKIYNPATPNEWANHIQYFMNQI